MCSNGNLSGHRNVSNITRIGIYFILFFKCMFLYIMLYFMVAFSQRVFYRCLRRIKLSVIALCVLHEFCSVKILYKSVNTFVFNCWCSVAFIFGLKSFRFSEKNKLNVILTYFSWIAFIHLGYKNNHTYYFTCLCILF